MATHTSIARIGARALNDVNDAAPGQIVAGAPITYPGQLGDIMVLNEADANRMSNSSYTLHAGVYQYVQFKAGTTASPARGGQVYWDNVGNFVVTPDQPTGAPGFAGVALNAVTKGNYGWIQVAGLATCHALANTTKGTPAIGDNLVLTSTAGAFDDLADATAIDGTNFKLVVGQWVEAPADASGGGYYLAWINRAMPNGR